MSVSATTKPIIKVNHIAPQVQLIGQQQTPVIVIDNFAEDIAQLIAIAVNDSTFRQDKGSYYPGCRTSLPKQYVIEVLNALYKLIYEVYRIPASLRLKPQQYVYSLIDKQPETLAPLQCLPHFDATTPHYFAILHYLNDGPHGNTGFFRHNLTDLERITAENIEDYFTKAQPFLDSKTQTPASYFVASDEHYSLYHQIEYRPNRLVIYPGNLLHSTIVNPQTDIDANPSSGRLTTNIFINFQ
ncbi:DUF6445 family protein [Shewanella vesiculosa]|uniref:DUF6445 family protein n=1 Tax=Shewanella vesiculosa TaxID=518738 RepID=A0ABV0FJ01_9GAMM